MPCARFVARVEIQFKFDSKSEVCEDENDEIERVCFDGTVVEIAESSEAVVKTL